MTTHWRDAGPEGWRTPQVLDVTDGYSMPDEEGWRAVQMFSFGGGPPDRVRLPPELDSRELRVLDHGKLAAGVVKCLHCGNDDEKKALELEDRYGVAQCAGCGQYNVFRRREETRP